MTRKSKLLVAWALALSPILLYVPTLMVAGIGPCAVSHPLVMVIAFLLFVLFEIAAGWNFATLPRSSGWRVGAILGMATAVSLFALNVYFEYYVLQEYLVDLQFSRR
jgi:hypothetical protein